MYLCNRNNKNKKDMIKQFTTYLRNIKGYSKNTADAYEADLRDFAKYMAAAHRGAKWSTIKQADILEYLSNQATRGLKPATTNRQLSAIRAIYNYFISQDMLKTNPARYIPSRKIEQTEPNTIAINDLEKAYKKADGALHTALGLLLETGIRIQELLDIRKYDLRDNGRIVINGKGAKQRIVVTSPELSDELNELSKNKRPEQLIFGGFYYSQRVLRHDIWELLRQTGSQCKQASPHAIRHTFATEIAKQGENVITLAKMLGHNNIRTTQRYIDTAQTETATAFHRYQTNLTIH